MTRAGTIPLSEIEWVKIYFNTRKLRSTTNNLKRMLTETGGDFLMNAAIFLRSGKLGIADIGFRLIRKRSRAEQGAQQTGNEYEGNIEFADFTHITLLT